MAPDVGALVRDARQRHGLTQAVLARRAGTTQKQISRIERGEISPSVATVTRLLAAVGERLELTAIEGPHDNRPAEELRADLGLTPAQRLSQTADLSRTLTSVASGAG